MLGPDGLEEPYDVLIIATGSLPFVPPIQGVTLPGRQPTSPASSSSATSTTAGASPLTRWASRSGAVIGGGLLGLEAARGLQNFSLDVHVIQRGDVLMSQQLDRPAGADPRRRRLEGLGIQVHLNKNTKRILGDERGDGLEFADDEKLECDLVVIAAGIKANSELGGARRAQRWSAASWSTISCAALDDPRIYALGECVQHRRPGVRPGRADLGAGQGAGRSRHGARTQSRRTWARRSRPGSR